MQSDPYLWLVIGGLLSIILSGRWTIALAGWMALLFLLHCIHAVPVWSELFGVKPYTRCAVSAVKQR
jgi:hypothetical protein